MQRTLTRDNKLTNYTMTIFFGDKQLFQSKIAIFHQITGYNSETAAVGWVHTMFLEH